MSSTQFSDNLKNAAGALGKILDDMAPFNDLKPHWPNAGKFELAQWLERIVDDRRNAVVAHAEHLRLMFEAMEVKLLQISKDFTGTDGDNAGKIKDALGDLKSKIENEWNTWDTNTENDHGNFGNGDEPEGNSSDGDGYNDNLNVPVGH